MAKILNLKSGDIAVVSPYNTQLIAEAKRRMGKWTTVNAPTGSVQAWKLDASHRAAMEQLLIELFPAVDTLIERVVTWTAREGGSYYAPTMDGYDVVGFGRDRSWFKRFDGGEPIKVVEVVDDNLDTGGSRNNPKLFGSVTMRLRCRPQAVAAGEGWSVEVVD